MTMQEFLRSTNQAKYGLIIGQSAVEHFQEKPLTEMLWRTFDEQVLSEPRKAIYHYDKGETTVWEGYFLVGKMKQDPKVEATLTDAIRDSYIDFPPVNHILLIGLKRNGNNINFKPSNLRFLGQLREKYRKARGNIRKFSIDYDFGSRVFPVDDYDVTKIGLEVKDASLANLTEQLKNQMEKLSIQLKINKSEAQV